MSNAVRKALAAAAGLAVSLALATAATAAGDTPVTVIDGGGRTVHVPARTTRVFAAGPPAAVLVLAVAPDTLIGWPHELTAEAKAWLPSRYAELPQVGRLAGRGGSSSPESVAALRPDLILDTGSADATHLSMAERVQRQTGIPYAVIDGRFADTPAVLRQAGVVLGAPARGEALARYAETVMADTLAKIAAVPPDKRPRVYLARGPHGLETGTKGAIHTEIIEYLGAVNVAGGVESTGLAPVSMEQVMGWDPDIVIIQSIALASDETGTFLKQGLRKDAWQQLRAVREHRVFLAPHSPFGWIDGPPGINRLVGLQWLAAVLYPDLFRDDLRQNVREFHRLFYGMELSDAQLDALIKRTPVP